MTKATAFFAALLLLLSGCSHTDTFERDSVPYQLRDQFKNLRFVWSAEPGIDLVAGTMVPVRAYFESYELVVWSRYFGFAYPGYDRVRVKSGPEVYWSDYRRPEYTDKPKKGTFAARPVGGVDYAHVLSLTPTGDGSIAALVCFGDYSISFLTPDGKWAGGRSTRTDFGEKLDPETGWGWVLRVVLKSDAQSNAGPPPVQLPPQQGPNLAPADDVFGTWRITGADTNNPEELDQNQPKWPDGSWGPEDWKTAKDQCMAKAPDPRAVRARWFYGEHDRPYPSPQPLPAPSPGWPASGS